MSRHSYTTTCPKCNGTMVAGGTFSTMVGYLDPSGHDHDDNCMNRKYVCGRCGHTWKVSIRRTCKVPGCEWKGKETCFCHEGKKLDEWPPAPPPVGDRTEGGHGPGTGEPDRINKVLSTRA